MSYFGKGTEGLAEREEQADQAIHNEHTRRHMAERITKIEAQVRQLTSTVNLLLSIMDADAKMKRGIERIREVI